MRAGGRTVSLCPSPSTMDQFLRATGEQEQTDEELSPEGPQHPAPRTAAPHLEVSPAVCAQLGHPAKATSSSSFTSPKAAPHALWPASDSKESKSSRRQSFWGPPGCPRGPSPHELTVLCCSCSPCPVCPKQLLGEAAGGLLPCPSAGTEPPFRSPQALPEVTILAFLFLLFCKINPLGSQCPLLCPTRPPDCVTSWRAVRGARLSGRGRHPDCRAAPEGPLGCHWDVGLEGG